jgi:hypothetical protein
MTLGMQQLIVGPLQLSKEEEGTGDEVEVRREDQDKINKFSRLHQKELKLNEELEAKNVSWPQGATPDPW